MFRASTIIMELALNLAKVIFILKYSVKLRRYLLCRCVAECHVLCFFLCCAECDSLSAQHTTHTPLHEYESHSAQHISHTPFHEYESHSAQHKTHTPFHDMLPHNHIITEDVISPNVLT